MTVIMLFQGEFWLTLCSSFSLQKDAVLGCEFSVGNIHDHVAVLFRGS